MVLTVLGKGVQLTQSFTIALVLFLTLKIPGKRRDKKQESKYNLHQVFRQYGRELGEGFRFVLGSIIAKFFIASVVANAAIGASLAILPAYADLRGGPQYYGFFMAAMSAGTLLGALISSSLERFRIGLLAISAFAMGACFWLVAALIPWVMASVLLYGMAWVPIGATNVMFAAVLQRIIPERLLARTFSVNASISASAMPLGPLVGGAMASSFGSHAVFLGTGFGVLFISAVWLVIPDLCRLPKTNAFDPAVYGLSDKKQIESS